MKSPAWPRCLRLAFVFVSLLLGSGAWAQMAGVAVYKDRAGQADDYAKVLPFQRMVSYAAVTNFFTGASAPVIIERGRLVTVVTFDDIATRDLLGDGDKAVLLQKQDELRQVGQRFAAARAYLNPVAAEITANLLRLNNGEVRYRGAWTSAASHAAMLARQREMAAEETKRMQAAAEDRKRRETNLASARQNLAAQWLLKTHESYLAALEKERASAGAGGTRQITLPGNVAAGALTLPKHRGGEVGLKEGLTATAPALLFVNDKDQCISCRLAFTIVYEEDQIANHGEMQAAAAVLEQMEPGLASWLPLAVVSGQTRLDFLKNSSQRAEVVKIEREISGTKCELTMTAATVHDDGSVHSIATLTIR